MSVCCVEAGRLIGVCSILVPGDSSESSLRTSKWVQALHLFYWLSNCLFICAFSFSVDSMKTTID